MNYYLLNTMPLEDDDLCFLALPPVGIELVDYKIAKGMPIAAEYPPDVRMYMDDEHPGVKMPDLIGNSRGLFIVTARVKEEIACINQAPTEYLPVSIYNHKRRRANGSYFFVNPLGTLDCLDLQRSEIERDDDGKIISVETFVLDPKKVENAPDLFRVKENPYRYVLSEKLARALAEMDPSNFYLDELEPAS
jgi:hypothetical protein